MDIVVEEEEDEALLNRLMDANEQIDKLSDSGEVIKQSELKRQVTEVLRRLEKEIEQNKFMDVLTPKQAQE